MITEMDPDTRDTDPMESMLVTQMPIGGDVAADSGQSVSEAGALRLPSVAFGLVITNVADNAGERRPSAESKEPSSSTPLRRLRAKTTVVSGGTSGGGFARLRHRRGAPGMDQAVRLRSLWG